MPEQTTHRQKKTQRIFDQAAPETYLQAWRKRLQVEKPSIAKTQGIILMSLGKQTLAWPAAQALRSLFEQPIHLIQQKNKPFLLGMAHHQGQFLPCMNLHALLGIPHQCEHMRYQRLLSVGTEQQTWLFPVDAFLAYDALAMQDIRLMPSDKKSHLHIGTFSYRELKVSLLDAKTILEAFEKAI